MAVVSCCRVVDCSRTGGAAPCFELLGVGVTEGPRYSPIVIRVYSHCILFVRYLSCIGQVGNEYEAVTFVFKVSACVAIALKSFTVMPTCKLSSTLKASKSRLSIVIEVCNGCLRMSSAA